MRRNLTIIAMTSAFILALATGIGDLLGKSDIFCSSSACMKVHSSSFGAVFSIPTGFYAAAFLLIAVWFYHKGKERLSLTILWGLLGIESYFTFVAIFFIGSFCTACLIFFGLLLTCTILARAKKNKNAMLAGLLMFFAAHFILFYPGATLKPTLTMDVPDGNSVQVFASPSCSHCEHAIENLRKICKHTGTQLIVRPVSISTEDMEKSVKLVSGRLFQCGSPISYRLSEKIVWENEDEAKKLNDGKLAVPLIVVRMGASREIYRGWNKQILESITRLFGAVGNVGTAEANNLAAPANLTGPGGMCKGTLDCNE
jgi:uncharacterized membrane protein